MTPKFETFVKRWPIFDDHQHWKLISSTGHTDFVMADDDKRLKVRIAEFQMNVRAALGQPIEEIDSALAMEEAEKLIAEATDFTVDDLLIVDGLSDDIKAICE